MNQALTIVLARPQLGVNIGSAARAMANFGLTDLRLVAPRDGWPSAEAEAMSAGAFEAGVRVSVFASVGDALADRRYVLAATARRRRMQFDLFDPETAARRMKESSGECAVLFGPENAGLTSEDMAGCAGAVRIPVSAKLPSLNLAHSVCVIAYAWRRARVATPDHVSTAPELARMDELSAMVEQLTEALEARGYFFPDDKAPSMRLALKNCFSHTGWTSRDVNRFRGVIASLTRPCQRGGGRVRKEGSGR